MDAINLDILQQLQEYAKVYFDAIVETNSECGKCKFADGKYTAKDVTKWNCRRPDDDMFDEVLTLESGTFKCKFPYRVIFDVLNDWETMSKAGKLKAVFEIGETEVKSAKVLTGEKSALGAFKTKSIKLQRIGGNWWGLPKEIRNEGGITGYYELSGVMFKPGKEFWGKVEDESNQTFCNQFDDAEITKMLISYLAKYPDNDSTPYFAEVARLAGINTETEEAKDIAETVNVSEEDETEPAKHISEIMETCRTWDDEKRDYTDEYKYYTWLANHIPEHKATNKNTTELVLEEVRERISAAATLAAHGVPKCDIGSAVCAVVNRLAKMEDILQFYSRIEPPQSPETPQTVECTAEPQKEPQKPRMEPKQVIRNFRTTRNIPRHMQFVPRNRIMFHAQCSTAHHIVGIRKMIIRPPGYSPPIRGDCKIRCSGRAKPPDLTKTYQISNFKPP